MGTKAQHHLVNQCMTTCAHALIVYTCIYMYTCMYVVCVYMYTCTCTMYMYLLDGNAIKVVNCSSYSAVYLRVHVRKSEAMRSLETRPSPSSAIIIITLTFEPYRSYGGRTIFANLRM